MVIRTHKIKGALLAKARYLSSEFAVRYELFTRHGNYEDEIDLYGHILDHYTEALTKFIDDEDLVVDAIELEPSEILPEFSEMYFARPVEVEGETVEAYREKEISRMEAIVQKFVTLIATFAYHKYRYTTCPDDRKVEERNCYETWLRIKKYNRDNALIHDMTDAEMQATLMKWYENTELVKRPGLFETVDSRFNRTVESTIKTYVGKKPNIPASEMVEGYECDIAI